MAKKKNITRIAGVISFVIPLLALTPTIVGAIPIEDTVLFEQGEMKALLGVVAEQDLIRAVNEAPNLQRACQNLVTAANTAGGPDNISVILVQLIG